jgi:predicted PurR-regulated permease PerM
MGVLVSGEETSISEGSGSLSPLQSREIHVPMTTIHLLLHGRSLYAWILAFIPRTYREKLATTMHEVSDVVHAYVSGQLLEGGKK